VEHNFNNSPPPKSNPCLGDLQEQVVWNMTTWHIAVRSSNKPPIHPLRLSLSLSLSKKVFGILNLLTPSRLMNRVRSVCKSIMLQIWGSYSIIIIKPGPWSSKSLLTISWLGYHLQYPNDNNTYSQIKAKSNPESKSITNCRLERQ
jgi:hypothetical protein